MIIAALAATAALAAPTEAEKQLIELRHIYSQSCEVRAYAAFDDLCNRLKLQMREAEKAYRQAQKSRPKAGSAAVAKAEPAPETRDQ